MTSSILRVGTITRIIAVVLLAAVLLPAGSATAQRRPAAVVPSSVSAQLPAQPAAEGYIGQERCVTCHKAEVTRFQQTPHARLVTSNQRMDCESCHGPGRAHADGVAAARGDDALIAAAAKVIFSFRGKATENAGRCLSCHVTAETQQHFARSQHLAVGVTCQACHSMHLTGAGSASGAAPPPPQAGFFAVPRLQADRRWLTESLLKQSQPELCYACHSPVRAQFAQPFHHRVPEGVMKCTDCHSAHGTPDRSVLAAPRWETCVSCHAEKRGPFVFEHAAVRVEGCVACHTPHGSTSRFLLARRESRFLCLQCHGDPQSGQINVPHGRLGFQTRGDCTRCHVAIHGSNSDVNFLR